MIPRALVGVPDTSGTSPALWWSCSFISYWHLPLDVWYFASLCLVFRTSQTFYSKHNTHGEYMSGPGLSASHCPLTTQVAGSQGAAGFILAHFYFSGSSTHK